ncbi:hypothetical protein [Schlesneria sp. DSM 10557]|uniref:hypothetical protein n=1 Tax=Schlesneria sp. DSM 10557 TaxID=3044399 RepID=UPI0035A1126F
MKAPREFMPVVHRLRTWGLMMGGLGLLGSILAYFYDREHFYPSYLTAFLYWLGLALGSLSISMIHGLTGGGWGRTIRRSLEAGYDTVPLFLIFFVPIWLDVTGIYPWTNPDYVHHHEVLMRKSAYLTVTGFQIRALIYFAVWIAITLFLNRWSPNDERDPDSERARRLQTASGVGFIAFGFTFTLACVDWSMSLEPLWYSTMYALIQVAGQGVAALAFAVLVITSLQSYYPWSRLVTTSRLNDLGNLLLASTMFWAYCSFFQYLVIWSGNLPEENFWYVHRLSGGWQHLAISLVLLHFVVPFFLLLSRTIKRDRKYLRGIAGLLLLMRYVDLYWTVAPGFQQDEAGYRGLRVDWTSVVTWMALGGIWLTLFSWRLVERTSRPIYDPLLEGESP